MSAEPFDAWITLRGWRVKHPTFDEPIMMLALVGQVLSEGSRTGEWHWEPVCWTGSQFFWPDQEGVLDDDGNVEPYEVIEPNYSMDEASKAFKVMREQLAKDDGNQI